MHFHGLSWARLYDCWICVGLCHQYISTQKVGLGFCFLPRIPRHELPVIVVTQGVFSFLGVTSGRLIPIDICVMRIISLKFGYLVGLFMVFNATFNNISAISWRSVLLMRVTGVPGENHRPVASHWQTLSHNVVSSTPRISGVRTNYYAQFSNSWKCGNIKTTNNDHIFIQ